MRRILFITAAVLAMAAGASAQPAPWQPERLTAGWTFTPGMAVGAGWDNNVTVQSEANPRFSELVGLFSPRGELNFNGRRTRLNVGYSGAFEAYRTFSELNRYEQRARLSTRYQLTPRLSVDGRGSYTVTPTTDRLELGTVPFLDIGSQLGEGAAGAHLQVSSRTTIDGEYRFQTVRFDQDQENPQFLFLNGGRAHSAGARVTNALRQRLSVGAEWQFRRAELDRFDESFDVQTLAGTAGVRVGANTSFTVAAGTSYLKVATTGEDVWGPSVQATFDQQIRRAVITASYFRSFVPTFSFGGVTANQLFSSNVRAPLTTGGRLSLSAGMSLSRTSPVEEIGAAFEVNSLSLNTALSYQVAPWLRTEGFVTSSHQDSSLRGKFDRLRIGVQFVTFKPVRIE